jgi:HEAT repeat protein
MNMNYRRTAGLFIALVAGCYSSVSAQAPVPSAAMPTAEASGLASGWVLLAEGRFAEAEGLSSRLLGQFPRNGAMLAVAVEAAIGARGARAALDVYEGWLGGRTAEEVGVLRRIGRATLFEQARQTADQRVRGDALKALAGDGETVASELLLASAITGNVTDIRTLAALGHPQAVERIIGRMRADPGSKLADILVLAESRSATAAGALAEVLRDVRPENRAAAAEALGRMGKPDSIATLEPVLRDEHATVRLAAAGALLKLGDVSGLSMLRQLAASKEIGARRSAALLMSSQPDEAWRALVRGLASSADPAVRLDAARLLAPHEPEFSRALFESLAADANPAIRDEAAAAAAEAVGSTFADLRRTLRIGPARARVAAAARILSLTR